MGFRSGAYATVWEVKPRSDTMTTLRISITKKNKQTGEYEQEFGGYVAAVGTSAANAALKLKERDRIKLGDVDVTQKYMKDQQKEYVNYYLYSFEMADGTSSVTSAPASSKPVDHGDMEPPEEDDFDLPF